MSSIIEGYNYDIFISYRQKDNKHDGWVTEFVNQLKGELESTFKEDISIYFDENPHDGILETHSVDKSLEGKLNCLILIPIISQTYCDPKSFAWQHEFCAFNKLAKENKFGKDIRLTSGNVASRILPVKIHDLDPEDKALLENELGGVLRGIEFIYKEAGVNRPLSPNDDVNLNLNKTQYRNQVNKVANAVKEIITALKKQEKHPEAASKQDFEVKQVHQKNRRTKIIAGTIIGLALIILGIFLIPKLFKSSPPVEKSIAVLPFHNDSSDEENQYFINGLMDAILDNLCKIKDLRVISRTSVEQYRDSPKSIPEIAKELNVNYILEGGGQKYEEDIRLTVQLIDAKNDRHIWSNPYNRKTKDIFSVQSEIAQLIAEELKAFITPEERQLIEKAPTTSLTAYDFFQRGREEHMKYLTWGGGGGREALEKAENLYREALEYDSEFAQAYSGLAVVYWNKTRWSGFFSENYMDSVLILADIALSYDNQLAEAYSVKAASYFFKGNPEQALEEADKAIKFNPNDWMAYWGKGMIYSDLDLVKSIYNFNKAISLNRGSILPQLLITLGWVYHNAGFIDKFKNCLQEAIKLSGDSAGYYSNLGSSEYHQGNYVKAIKFLEKAHKIDTNRLEIFVRLGSNHMFLDHYRESLKYYKTYVERLKASGAVDLQNMQRVGYVYWQNGYKKEAEFYFNKQLEYCNESIGLGREYSRNLNAFYDLAGIYAFRGDRDKAIENLRKFNQRKWMNFFIYRFIKEDPLFESIRDDPEFQEIVGDIEGKYHAEHERVKKWLEEEGKQYNIIGMHK
jgi:TolB-like protein/Tfp pilus assembly protein PilF